MTRKELQVVKKVLEDIKPREDGLGQYGSVILAISLIDKEIAMREDWRDNSNSWPYEYDERPY